MSQAGIVDIEGSHPQIPTAFITNSGTAIPIANTLEILGMTVAAHSIPLETTGSGNTVTIEAQYSSAAASSIANNAGFASFNSTYFTVDANGYVSLNGSVVGETITGNTGGPLSPVAGNWNILGSSVAAGTIPVETVGSGNTLTVQVQTSQAIASTNASNIGLAAFNSTYFTVDSNGFVSLKGSAVTESFTVDASTAPGTNPVVPNGSGVVTVTGGQVAAGTTASVIRTNSLAANTYTIQIQRSQAVASSTVGDNGVSHFNSAYFTVDGNGFVSLNGSAVGETITGNTGGALSPTSGNWNILGTSTAAGTTPVQTSGTGSTLTVQVQKAQAIASTNATNVGLAAFNSTYFTVDSNGFVSLSGSTIGQTITGNTGGALSPTAGNWNILGTSTAAGTTPVQTSGSGSTLTVQVQKAQAIASTNATNVGLAAFNSSDFSVDANGFVAAASTGYIRTITGTSGGAESPASGGNFNLLGATAAAGTTPVVIAGSANTETVKVQISQAIASTNATNVGLAAFSSTYFTVDANGFVALSSIGALLTFDGDTGSATPSSGIITFNANSNSGSTVLFSATSHTVSLKVSDSSANMFIGSGTGNASISGTGGNTGLGSSTLSGITTGAYNVGVGYSVLNALRTGSNNVAIGQSSLNDCTGSSNTAVGLDSLYQLVGGSNNIGIGNSAGGNYTGSEASNICIGNAGTAAESNAIHIGTQGSGSGQQNTCYIAGIIGVTASNAEYVTINSSTGQLGVASIPGTAISTIDGDSGSMSGATVTISGGTTGLTTSASSATMNITGTLNVGHGGTGNATATAYALIAGGTTTTGNFQSITNGAASSTVLIGNGSSALPSYSAYPQITGLGIGASAGSTAGLTFDGSNFMSAYSVGTWTPTITGATSAGTTTYSSQTGYYTKIGNLVTCYCYISISAATGTGNVVIGGLPFTIKNQSTGYVPGSIWWTGAGGWTFPTGSTALSLLGNPNTTTCNIYAYGSLVNGGQLQMANSGASLGINITYQV